MKEKPQARVLVICDDTDVFVLLTHYYTTEKMECQLFTQGPTRGRKLISIQGTALNTRTNLNTDPELLLPLHALTGCDSVSAYLGIGKSKTLTVLRNNSSLNLHMLGDLSCNFDDIYMMASVSFISLCYGCKPEPNGKSIIPARIKLWHRKVATATRANPSLQRLPPTDSSLRANVRIGHYQAAIWRSCSSPDPLVGT